MDPLQTRFDSLMQTQFLEPEAFSRNYDRMLDRLLRHAIEQTPGYRERLASVVGRDGKIDLSRWSEIPILTREDAQADPGAITAREVPPEAGATTEGATSGSTGRIFAHRRSSLMLRMNAAATARGFSWHGADWSKTFASILLADVDANPDDPAAGLVSESDGAKPLRWRRQGRLSIRNPVEVQLDWLDRVLPDFVMTYPSNAADLARIGHGRLWTTVSPTIFCAGEGLSGDQRRSIRDATGAGVASFYGAMETGLIAVDCPSGRGMHVMAELAKVEILDEDGSITRPGEIGNVVVTPLWNYAMPFIRYSLGDLARVSDIECLCGRGLPLIGEVMGRVRNMFVRPDGSRFWPVIYARQVAQCVPYRQHQFIQHDHRTVEFRYVPQALGQAEDRDGLIALAQSQLYPEVELLFTPLERISRSDGGKFEDYRCLVNE